MSFILILIYFYLMSIITLCKVNIFSIGKESTLRKNSEKKYMCCHFLDL